MTEEITRVNLYREGGDWFFSAWSAEGWDHNAALEVESEDDAYEVLGEMFPSAEIVRLGSDGHRRAWPRGWYGP